MPKTWFRVFFDHLIGSGLATVDRSKGRFRSFLLASFAEVGAAAFARATERLQEEQAATGRAEIFGILKGFLGGGRVPVTYEEAARALGDRVGSR
jgi:hypothetical protein